jgi:hypothetical protein
MDGEHMVIKNTVREHDPPSYEGPLYVKKKFLENFQEMSIFVGWVQTILNLQVRMEKPWGFVWLRRVVRMK